MNTNNNNNAAAGPKIHVTAQDAEEMLDTATQNPDKQDFTCPPDGVRGLSTITRQKLARTVSFKIPGALSDIWLVQWDHEPTRANGCTGSFYVSTAAEDAPGYRAGVLVPPPQVSWTDAGYANTLVTGGLCIYYMKPGQSPFPAADGSGPYAPLAVEQMLYSDDVLHDMVRVLGSNFELVDTTNALNQQGNVFQGAWDANQEDEQGYQLEIPSLPPPAVPGLAVAYSSCRPALCPPGTTDDLVKLNNNRVAAAKEGLFVMNRLDWSNNKPSSSDGLSSIYQSIDDHPATGALRVYLRVANADTIFVPSAVTPPANPVTISTNATQTCRVYPTGVQMNCTVLTGLHADYTATISRTVTTQCFIRPGGKFSAFARMSYMPVDYAVLAALQNVMDNVQMFAPSSSNASGKFAKMAKGLWKKVSPIVKPIASVAGTVLRNYAPSGIKAAIDASEQVVQDVYRANPRMGPLMNLSREELLDFNAPPSQKKARRKKALAALAEQEAPGAVAAVKRERKKLAKAEAAAVASAQ